jgi:hypothetical protein
VTLAGGIGGNLFLALAAGVSGILMALFIYTIVVHLEAAEAALSAELTTAAATSRSGPSHRVREPEEVSRISEIFIAEGLSWRHVETWFGERVDPDFAKKGAIESLYTAPPADRVTVCLD